MSNKSKGAEPRKVYYQVTPLVSTEIEVAADKQTLHEGMGYIIRGKLQDHIIVSLPVTASYRAASELREKLISELKKPVIVVTHNVNFLKVEKLGRKEVVALNERILKNDSARNRSGASEDRDSDSGIDSEGGNADN